MTYNPSEPRDPLGKWMKAHGGNPKASLADNVKSLNYAEEHGAAVDTKNTPTTLSWHGVGTVRWNTARKAITVIPASCSGRTDTIKH